VKFKKLNHSRGVSSFVLVFERGEEVTVGLTDFAEEQRLMNASFTGLGAFERCTVAYYNMETKQYENTDTNEVVEVISLNGNITEYQQKPKLHAHVVIGKRDSSAHGGHLVAGIVGATLEISLTAFDTPVVRQMNEDIGLPLIDLDA